MLTRKIRDRMDKLIPDSSIMQGNFYLDFSGGLVFPNIYAPVSINWLWDTRTEEVHLDMGVSLFDLHGEIDTRYTDYGIYQAPDRYMPKEEIANWLLDSDYLENFYENGLIEETYSHISSNPLFHFEDDRNPENYDRYTLSGIFLFEALSTQEEQDSCLDIFQDLFAPLIQYATMIVSLNYYNLTPSMSDRRIMTKLGLLCIDCLGEKCIKELRTGYQAGRVISSILRRSVCRRLRAHIDITLTWHDLLKDIDLDRYESDFSIEIP